MCLCDFAWPVVSFGPRTMSEALLSEAPPESRLASCEEQESALWSVGATLKKKIPCLESSPRCSRSNNL